MERKRKSIDMQMSIFDKGDTKFDKSERLSRRLNRRFKSAKVDVNNSGVNTSLDDYVDQDDNSDDDPDYLTFLKHLRENGNSYILEIALNDEMPLQIIYEKDGEFIVDDDGKPDNLKRFKDVSRRNSVNMKRVLRSSGKNKENSEAWRSVPNKKREISPTVEDVKLERGVKVNATQKPRSLMREVKQEMGSAMEEEDDYESFLKCLELDGDSLVMVTKDGKRTKYEEDEENPASDSDLDIEVIEVDPQPLGGIPSPFVTSKIYYHDRKGFSSSNDSKFREKLTDILRKPFNQKDYDELYKEAFEQKPVERCRELRSGTKRYAILENLGKSYLDHHPDLKYEIHSVRHNRYMVLKLLRGFFFWLKNVSHDGGFRPWLDKSCLEQIRQP